MRLLSRLSAIGAISLATLLASASGCARATQTYTMLAPEPRGPAALGAREPGRASTEANSLGQMVGSLSVERIQGGQRVVTLQLNQLPPPERIAPGLRAFVVWLEDPRGRKVKVGTLHYDRLHHSGNLLATTGLAAFTVRVTGERDDSTSAPSGVLLAERRVGSSLTRPRTRLDSN
jgi:hypothetical protein